MGGPHTIGIEDVSICYLDYCFHIPKPCNPCGITLCFIQMRQKFNSHQKGVTTKDAITGWCLTAVRNGRLVGAKTNKAERVFCTFPRGFLWENYAFGTRM